MLNRRNKFHKSPSSGSRRFTCGKRDGRTHRQIRRN